MQTARIEFDVPFNRPTIVGTELEFVRDASERHWISGGGHFSRLCEERLEKILGAEKACLTPSCTAALELSAIIAGIGPGDEVIMPSYTFVSTANAFALFGARIVFVDVCPDTMNIDHRKLEAAITPKTKSLVVVHYAGLACEMDEICRIAKDHNLVLIEDAAQAIGSTYRGRALGSFGAMSAFSFHETKNLTSGGEGGVLVVNNPDLVNKAVVARDKGTNRANFLDGKVDKYTWVSQGSSYLMNEISAAWLWAQLQQLDFITDRRRVLNNNYRKMLEHLVDDGNFEIQSRPDHATPNGHIFYLKTRTADERIQLLNKLAERGIHATFHYVPLHSSPAGLRFGRFSGTDSCTSSGAERLIRLPLFHNMSDAQQSMVIDAVNCACS